jgi:hypothetical protein
MRRFLRGQCGLNEEDAGEDGWMDGRMEIDKEKALGMTFCGWRKRE